MITLEEYRKALDDFADLTVEAAKNGTWRTERMDPRHKELRLLINEFEASSNSYEVVCIKSYYVGQGRTWEPGDRYSMPTYDIDYANKILNMLNSDPWTGGIAWELKIIPPIKENQT